MRARSAAPCRHVAVIAVAHLRRTDGASSVAAMESSVDLPAPLGPSSADDLSRLAAERDPVERAAAAEVPGDVVEASAT